MTWFFSRSISSTTPVKDVTEINENGVAKEVERKIFPGYVLIKMVMTDDT